MPKTRVSRRSDGRYYATLTTGIVNDKRVRKYYYGSNAAEVTAQVVAAQHDLAKGLPVVLQSADTVQIYGKHWLETSLKLTAKGRSFESIERILQRHVYPTLGSIRLTQLTPGQVQQLLANKLATGLSPQTVQHIRSALRSLLSKALKMGIVVRNVAASAYVDVPRIPYHEVAVLTPEQARHFLACAVGERYEGIYLLAISCGLRKGEILGLRWSDLDLDQSTLRVTQTIQRLRTGSTEYRKKTALTVAETKTVHSRRWVALPPFVVKYLLKLRERADLTGLVFVTKRGNPIEGFSLHMDYKALLLKAKLPNLRFHDLRHVAASLLLAKGVHPRMVMELLGHSNIAITMNIYSHVLESSKRDVADAMALVLGR